MGSFQYEAQVKQQECDTTQKKLSDVRKLIAKLLKSINEVILTHKYMSIYDIFIVCKPDTQIHVYV